MSFEQMGGSENRGPRPDAIPPASGRTSRRKPDDITAARRLRDDVLKLVEEQPRTETEIVQITGRTKGEVKAALRRLAVADLVFSRETGNAYRDPPLWHHWPTMIASLRQREATRTVTVRERTTGMRVA